MSKSKNVKLPVALVEILEKRGDDRTPGEVLLSIVQDYERLESRARCIAEQSKTDMNKVTVSEIILPYIDNKLNEYDVKLLGFQKSYDELKTMYKGLNIFLKKEWSASAP